MELSSKLLQKIVFKTRPKFEENMLIVMDKCIREEHLSQPLQTSNKQFKLAITFLTGYNGFFNVTSKNNSFNFAKSITDKDCFIQLTIPQCAYKIESLNNEIKRIFFEGHFTEIEYSFTLKLNFLTLGSIIELARQEPLISFSPIDRIRDLSGFSASTICEEYNLSPNPVDTLSFDHYFVDTYISQGIIFKGKRSGIIHNFTTDVDPEYKYIEKFRGGLS